MVQGDARIGLHLAQLTPRGEMFEIDPSSFGGCHDLPGYRGIGRKCCHAFEALGLVSLPWPFVLFHGALFGKQLVCSYFYIC